MKRTALRAAVRALALCSLLLAIPALADLRFVDEAPPEKQTSSMTDYAHVQLFGKISEADAKALSPLIYRVKQRSALRSADEQGRVQVFLNSPGGEILAAMRIGELLRANDAMVWVNGECSSACVFVFAGGVERNLIRESRVGLHRPFFEQKFFAGLSSQQAQRRYGELIARCKSYMRSMGITDALFEDMLRVPSQKIQYVDRKYAEEVRLLGTDPAYEEWTRAKSVKELGPARLKARDGFLSCVNSGDSMERCKILHPF